MLMLRTQDEHTELSEGFWRELFLLKPDRGGLQSQTQRLSVEDVLHGYSVRSLVANHLQDRNTNKRPLSTPVSSSS